MMNMSLRSKKEENDKTQKAREFINNKTQEGFERNQINKSFTILCYPSHHQFSTLAHTHMAQRCTTLNGTKSSSTTNNCDPAHMT